MDLFSVHAGSLLHLLYLHLEESTYMRSNLSCFEALGVYYQAVATMVTNAPVIYSYTDSPFCNLALYQFRSGMVAHAEQNKFDVPDKLWMLVGFLVAQSGQRL